MEDILQRLRSLYKGKASFATILPDGVEVPWRPLSIGEYNKYLRKQGIKEEVEDEIFNECVADEYLKRQMPTMKAGIVSTVVDGIFAVSVPSSIEEFQYLLDYHRYLVYDDIIDQMVLIICQAFPGYTPREVYSMEKEEFIHHVALAERKLFDTGILREPLTFFSSGDQQQKQKVEKKDTRHLRDAWIAQQQERQGIRPPMPPQQPLPVDPLPVPDWDGEQTVISSQDIQEHNMIYDGHEKNDADILANEMINETAGFYKDYIDMMRKGVKITPDKIKTVDERRRAATERLKENEVNYFKKVEEEEEKKREKNRRLEELYQKHLPKKHKNKKRR